MLVVVPTSVPPYASTSTGPHHSIICRLTSTGQAEPVCTTCAQRAHVVRRAHVRRAAPAAGRSGSAPSPWPRSGAPRSRGSTASASKRRHDHEGRAGQQQPAPPSTGRCGRADPTTRCGRNSASGFSAKTSSSSATRVHPGEHRRWLLDGLGSTGGPRREQQRRGAVRRGSACSQRPPPPTSEPASRAVQHAHARRPGPRHRPRPRPSPASDDQDRGSRDLEQVGDLAGGEVEARRGPAESPARITAACAMTVSTELCAITATRPDVPWSARGAVRRPRRRAAPSSAGRRSSGGRCRRSSERGHTQLLLQDLAGRALRQVGDEADLARVLVRREPLLAEGDHVLLRRSAARAQARRPRRPPRRAGRRACR